MSHGGKRRRHVLPALTTYQVNAIRAARAAGVGYKELMRWYSVSRETLSKAANGSRTYRGYA